MLFLLMFSFQHENPVLVKEHNHDASQVGVAKMKADLSEKAKN